MCNPLLSILFGQVSFTALGGRYERLLDDCVCRGIPVAGIRPIPGGITAKIPVRYYRRLHPLARHWHVRLRVQKRQGLCFAVRRYRGRWGLLLGPVLFCVMLLLMQQLVWSIQFVQLPAEQQQNLYQALCSMGLGPGARATPDRVERVRQQLVLTHPELGWISLNFIQGRLVVESAPAQPAPPVEGNENTDLLAAVDGVILSLNVQEGYCDKRPGQTVGKGDVLIAAQKPDRSGVMIPSHARGQVIALAEEVFECIQPQQYTAQFPTGKLKTAYTVHLAGWQLPLGTLPEGENQIKTRWYPVTLLGFALPVAVQEQTCVEIAAQQVQISGQAAREFADYACRQALFRAFPDAKIQKEHREEQWRENACILRLAVQFQADIARLSFPEKCET